MEEKSLLTFLIDPKVVQEKAAAYSNLRGEFKEKYGARGGCPDGAMNPGAYFGYRDGYVDACEEAHYTALLNVSLVHALGIRKVKRGCTFRRLAELYVPKGHVWHGNQLFGMELVDRALKALEIDINKIEFGQDAEFDAENKSHSGDFYWWE